MSELSPANICKTNNVNYYKNTVRHAGGLGAFLDLLSLSINAL